VATAFHATNARRLRADHARTIQPDRIMTNWAMTVCAFTECSRETG
jgi:hypothetical protein